MELFFSLQSFFISILSLLFFYLSLCFFTLSNKPGFKTYPLLGALPSFISNRHRFLEWSTQVLRTCPTNTAVFRRPGRIHGVLTANPDNIQHILKTKFENYPKGERFISFLQDFLGTGIFNSDGDLWKLQRKTASYEFNTKSLRNFIVENVTVETQTRLIPILSKAAEKNNILDLQDILECFAFDNVCKLAFNVDPGCLSGDGTSGNASFMRAFEDAAVLSSGRFMSLFPMLWKVQKILNVGAEGRLKQSIATVHKFADEIIRSRMEEKNGSRKGEDLLSRFIATEEASPEFLRDIVISFILAGRDTTSAALSWFFWILSSRIDVKEKIIKEIETVRSRSGDKMAVFGFEELREMQYLHAAITEAMRLYPPVPVDTKACLNDDVLPDGTRMKKGWFISYHTYAMGRMESVWGEDCNEYKPERWLENEKGEGGVGVCRSESAFKFPVFHAGPRMCLGKEMAYIQMKSIAASVMERFEVVAVEKEKIPEHVLSLTLRMKNGLPVSVRMR
ncbi:cytochrome P450 CYP94D108-like [Vicia villosa]|uniref:cytochrome P450 CYP94D108-like n=1 Tax=Vicia villosa TaxID=3911 RepID=UPI00273C95A9|nr:cytochrome P450 CYP94D108-like [Vicia villosa]